MRNPAGELYGADRLSECVRINRELEPEALVDAIRKAAVAFAQSDRLSDDLTCVAVKVGEAQRPLARSELEIQQRPRGSPPRPRIRPRLLPHGSRGASRSGRRRRARAGGERGGQQHHEACVSRPYRSADSAGSRRVSRPCVDPAASSGRFVRPGRRLAARAGRLAGVGLRHLSHHQERGRGSVLSRRTREELYYARQGSQLLDAKDNAMQIAFEKVGDVAVAAVPVDELDASNAGEFKRDIAPLLEANAKLVLDLSRLRFVDSSGLGAFISCLRKLNAKGGDLKLCGMSKQVRAVFELVRMHRVFDILGTKEDAVRGEPVADPGLAEDVLGGGRIGFDLLAELGHQRPQMFRLFNRVRSPDRLQDRAMGQHAVVIPGQQRQELEFLGRQPDLRLIPEDAAPVVVDRQVPGPEVAGLRSSSDLTRRSATRMRASSSSGPNGLVT